MRHRFNSAMVVAALCSLLPMQAMDPTASVLAVGSSLAAAEQAYTPPHTADGLPDLQGVWQVINTAAWDIQDHHAAMGVPAGQSVVVGNEIPYQAWALARKKENFENRQTADPLTKCYMPGVPRVTYVPFPFQIFQTAKKVVIAYEYIHIDRVIYTDGTPHPYPPIVDFWMGDSRGRYEGDTLVVDVSNLNDQTWLDAAGNFHSDALHLVERYTRVGPDHINYEVTVEDPKVFTRPWKMNMILYRRKEPNAQILEYECYAYALEEGSAK
jgi:hypothetical protein